DIVVGQIGPFTVLPAPDASQLNQGLKAGFARINAHGGINGRRVGLFELDDKYSGDGFAAAFAEALRRRPVALMSPVGSAALQRLLDARLLDADEVVVLNAIPGAEALRHPGHPMLFHVRAGDREQIETAVINAHTLGITRLGVIYQNIVMGSSGIAVAQQAAAKAGALEISGVETSAEAARIAAAAAQVVKSGAQAALAIGAPRFMADCVTELRRAGMKEFIFLLSYAPAAMVAKVAGAAARGVAIAQTYPNPFGDALPLQRDFHAAMKAAFPQVSGFTSFHLEGFICAQVFAEAARRTRDLDAPSLARSLHAMGEIDLGGFRVDFSRGNTGSRYVDIGVIDGSGHLIY
ncbi:MAG: ABC transporter substrate-binding protein, partial [Burkholderiales bacterium]|nr:ABC transporter substrate-binding protein [Burkholderiales bacterium]